MKNVNEEINDINAELKKLRRANIRTWSAAAGFAVGYTVVAWKLINRRK